MLEIERKFLIKNLPKKLLENIRGEEILQGYIQISPEEIRLRKRDIKFFLTMKSEGGVSREEVEVEVSKPIFDILWPLTKDKRIEKVRYTIPLGELKAEIDVYSNQKIVVEVEIPTEHFDFVIPNWFGKEVTEDKWYKNKNLAVYGFPD
jgi:adenylate cyclase